MAARSTPRNDVERRIHFYRADCGQDAKGKRIPFIPAPALQHISSLPFASLANGGRYHEEGDSVYCCWPESPTRAQFAVIRRGALPTIEEKGIRKALNLSATAGLVEAIHLQFFPDNIVGFDFNFYGPRLPRFGRYLSAVAKGHADEAVFEPLLRHDTAAELEDGKELRMFALRIRRSEVSIVEAVDKSLAAAFKGVMSVTNAQELEVVVRPQPYSRKSIGKHLLNTTRKLAKRSDIREAASGFRVQVASPGEPMQTVDLLGDHFISDTRILRQTKNGRALDPADAYKKIEAAFKAKEADLRGAASIA